MKAFTAILVFLTVGMAHAVSYPLTCNFSGVDSASWRPNLSNPNSLIVSMGFRHSDKPASAGVPEGTCAWQDRGMYPNEPTIIAQEVMNIVSIHEVNYQGKSTLVTAPTPWAAVSKIKGTQVIFKVHADSVSGIAVPVLKIDN